jgi:hypothetical protein
MEGQSVNCLDEYNKQIVSNNHSPLGSLAQVKVQDLHEVQNVPTNRINKNLDNFLEALQKIKPQNPLNQHSPLNRKGLGRDQNRKGMIGPTKFKKKNQSEVPVF